MDLFPARGVFPANLSEVGERENDIRYSSRTRASTESLRRTHGIRHNINTLWEKLPEKLRATPEAQFLNNLRCVTTMDIVELIYRPDRPQGQTKDFEFNRESMNHRWAYGLADAQATLNVSPWLALSLSELGARTFDVLTASRQQQAKPEEAEGEA